MRDLVYRVLVTIGVFGVVVGFVFFSVGVIGGLGGGVAASPRAGAEGATALFLAGVLLGLSTGGPIFLGGITMLWFASVLDLLREIAAGARWVSPIYTLAGGISRPEAPSAPRCADWTVEGIDRESGMTTRLAIAQVTRGEAVLEAMARGVQISRISAT